MFTEAQTTMQSQFSSAILVPRYLEEKTLFPCFVNLYFNKDTQDVFEASWFNF